MLRSNLKELREFQRHPLGYLEAARRRHGDRHRLALPGLRLHFFFTPVAAQHVLIREQRLYGRCAPVFDKIRPLTGRRGLVQLEGAAWKALRQRYAPVFGPGPLTAATAGIDACARRSLATLAQAPQTVDMLSFVATYVLDNAMRLFAGQSVDPAPSPAAPDLAASFLALNERCGVRMLRPLNLPSLTTRRLRRQLDESVDRYLTTSPLALPGMPAALLRDQLKTFLFAGHETTTSSIVSALHLLAVHPEAQQDYHRLDDADRDVFLQQIYDEALRLYPPAWLLVRTAVADDPELGVRRGDHVFLAVREIHRHPDYWARPESFVPARFADLKAHPGQFIPYGGGAKMCIGRKLAPLEAARLLKPLLERFDLSTQTSLTMMPHITLFPQGPVPLSLAPRSTAVGAGALA